MMNRIRKIQKLMFRPGLRFGVCGIGLGLLLFATGMRARADVSGYDDRFSFGGATQKAKVKWKKSSGGSKLAYLSVPTSSHNKKGLSEITGSVVNSIPNPFDPIITSLCSQYPGLKLTDFVFDGTYDVLPSGDYFFYASTTDYAKGLKVIPGKKEKPVMTANVHTQGITIGKDGSWGQMDLTLSDIEIDNRIHSGVLDEFAGGDGTGAARIDFTADWGENILCKFKKMKNFEVRYAGEVGAGGGSAVPTPAEWATLLMACVVLGGYGMVKSRQHLEAIPVRVRRHG